MLKKEIADICSFSCRLAYKKESRIKEEIEKKGYKYITGITIEDLFAFVIEYKNNVYFAFRGSDNLLNWLRDMNVLCNDKGEHQGFYSASMEFYFQILELLYSLRGQKIIFTGHSLGGSIAASLSYKIDEYSKLKIDILATEGQPAIFKKGCVPSRSFQYYRLVCNNDMVSWVLSFFGYVHDGKEMYFNKDYKLKKYNIFQKTIDKAKGLYYTATKFKKFDFVSDHNADNYIKCTNNL